MAHSPSPSVQPGPRSAARSLWACFNGSLAITFCATLTSIDPAMRAEWVSMAHSRHHPLCNGGAPFAPPPTLNVSMAHSPSPSVQLGSAVSVTHWLFQFQWLTRHHLLCNLPVRGKDDPVLRFQWLTRHHLLCNVAFCLAQTDIIVSMAHS